MCVLSVPYNKETSFIFSVLYIVQRNWNSNFFFLKSFVLFSESRNEFWFLLLMVIKKQLSWSVTIVRKNCHKSKVGPCPRGLYDAYFNKKNVKLHHSHLLLTIPVKYKYFLPFSGFFFDIIYALKQCLFSG